MDKYASVDQPQRESRSYQNGEEASLPGSAGIQQPIASPYPILCAHRGLSQACPENTLPAFASAMAVGAYEIEFDVWRSCDGVPVICHDATVDRTTNGTGRISDMRWDEIRRLDAGIKSGDQWRGIRMPRLEEVLDFTGSRITLNIHMKSEGPDGVMIKQVCDYLRKYGLSQTAYLALDTESALHTALTYAPEIARACLVSQNDTDVSINLAQRYKCQRIQFGRHVTEDQIKRSRDLGIICNLFWSDDPDDGRAYVKKGINVILTNCAHIMIAGGFKAFVRRDV